MKVLLAGHETIKRVNLLFKLTKISSEDMRETIKDHLCKGHSESFAVGLNGVTQSNFNRTLMKLNEVASIVEEIKEDDWAKFKSVK